MKPIFGKSIMTVLAMLVLLTGLSIPTQVRAASGTALVTDVTSSTTAGLYATVGGSIQVSVVFDEAVHVTGTPSLCFETGTTDRCVTYASGTGTATLNFTNYVVQAGDTSAHLDYVSTSSLSLNGGTITAVAAPNLSDLTLPALGTSSLFTKFFRIDTTAPTVGIGAPSATVTAGGPVTYTVTYADTNFNSSTLTFGNVTLNKTGTADASTVGVTGTGLTRTVTLSGITGDGTLGISLPAGTATDLATNSAPAAGPSATFAVDNTKPTVSIGTPSAAFTTAGPVTYTVTYADANFNSSTLAFGDVTLNKTGTADATTVGVSGTGLTRTVTLSGITGDGTLSISLAAGTATDLVGNIALAAGPSTTFTVDNTKPTVDTFTVPTPTTNFSVPISAFTASDGTGVTGYLITESATPPLAGAIGWTGTAPTTYSVAANGSYTLYPWAKDAVGNVSAVFGTPCTVFVADTTAPTVSIGTPSEAFTTVGPVTYTVTYADTNFNSSTLATGNITLNKTGTADATTVNVTGTGLTRTVTLSGITGNGTLGIFIAAGTATDLAGNIATAAGPSTTFTVDNTKPIVDTFTVPTPSASLSIPISAFTASDGTGVTGYLITESATPPLAGAVGWSGTAPTTYQVTANGSYTLYPWAKDAAGNVSAVFGTPPTVIVNDTTAPTVISSLRANLDPTAASSVNFTVTFSESVTGVNLVAPFSDFALNTTGVTGASISAVSGSGASYTVTVSTGTGNGTIRLDVVDDDTISDLVSNKLGGTGTGNGDFTGGQSYTVDKSPTTLVNSVLPTSRTVSVGTTATIFNTVINAGASPATGITLSMNPAPAGTFVYQQTDCATNAVLGTPDPSLDLAPGGVLCYVLSFTPSTIFSATSVHIRAQASNAPSTTLLTGINTWLLRSTSVAGPDIIALTTTTDFHQVACSGANAFAVALSNVGAAATGDITAVANTGTATLPLSISISETNPGTGAVIGDNVLQTVGAGENRTVAVFVTFNGCIAFDPAANRIFIEFRDASNNVVGSTSTAVSTGR